jgi:hypothetical protein
MFVDWHYKVVYQLAIYVIFQCMKTLDNDNLKPNAEKVSNYNMCLKADNINSWDVNVLFHKHLL